MKGRERERERNDLKCQSFYGSQHLAQVVEHCSPAFFLDYRYTHTRKRMGNFYPFFFSPRKECATLLFFINDIVKKSFAKKKKLVWNPRQSCQRLKRSRRKNKERDLHCRSLETALFFFFVRTHKLVLKSKTFDYRLILSCRLADV